MTALATLLSTLGLAMLVTTGAAGAGATPAPEQEAAPVERILIVGDSVAFSLAPYLEQAGAARGVEVFSAARDGCSVIASLPVYADGRPYSDIVMDGPTCAATTTALQDEALGRTRPQLVVWASGWEAWSHQVIDGELALWGTLGGNQTVLREIDEDVQRFATNGARVAFLPVPPNAYPSDRGVFNPTADTRKLELAKLLRSYVRQHPDVASYIDVLGFLCPGGGACPGDVGGGIRPRPGDGSHFEGPGAQWAADRIMDLLVAPPAPPPAPGVPSCTRALVGAPRGEADCGA